MLKLLHNMGEILPEVGGWEVDLIHEQSSDPAAQLTIQAGSCPLPPKSAPKLIHSNDDDKTKQFKLTCLNIAGNANAVPCHSLFKGHNVNDNIVVQTEIISNVREDPCRKYMC